MAIEQQIPEISHEPIDALSPLTEAELCAPGSVKLIHTRLLELKEQHRSLTTQFQNEHARNDKLTVRAVTAETQLQDLRETLFFRQRRELMVRLLELVIIGLIEFAIETAKAQSWVRCALLSVFSLVLVAVIALMQWPPRKPEKN